MLILSEMAVADALAWPELIEALREGFRHSVTAPPRHHHEVPLADPPGEAASLLIMPAWQVGGLIGVKLVNVFQHNSRLGKPGISGTYIVFDANDGTALAALEGGELTARRTAAASALGADYLARADASTHLMVGTGRLALNVPQAMAAIRPIERVLVWGRSFEKAVAAARDLEALGLASEPVRSIEAGLTEADIVSVATNSQEPLIEGAHVRPGTHVDLIGAFKPTMRECDGALLAKADLLVADTFEGAFEEAGDILQAIDEGAITKSDVRAEMADLCHGRHAGRAHDDEITVFKSCGAALEDLVAAKLALKSASG